MPIKWPEGKRPCFIGTGNTKATRYGTRSLSSLVHEAAMNAIADAGLKPEDIDGIATYPNAPYGNARNIQGYDTVDDTHIQHILPLNNIKWSINSTNRMAVTSLIEAVNALGSGAVNYVMVFRALHHPAGERYNQSRPGGTGGASQWDRPYGGGVANQRQAMNYMRYLEKFGAKREEMAATVLNDNRNAQLNEYAVWNGRVITFEDYMNSRIISWPMCIFDNDMPVDEAGAVIMTTEDRAKDTPHPGGYIAGYAVTPSSIARPNLFQTLEENYEVGYLMAKNLYESSGFSPQDVDLIHVYNGYSPMVWNWLEVFGFCPEGEAHNWVQGGTIALEGPHPLNTAGGNLGEGRLHGWSHIRETAQQMMGVAGPRQLQKCDVALCEVGPFANGACFICTRE